MGKKEDRVQLDQFKTAGLEKENYFKQERLT
jgi:hypothetical protein